MSNEIERLKEEIDQVEHTLEGYAWFVGQYGAPAYIQRRCVLLDVRRDRLQAKLDELEQQKRSSTPAE